MGEYAECAHVVRRAWGVDVWGSKWYKIHMRIRACHIELLKWRRQSHVNSGQSKEFLGAKLQQLFECPNFDRDDFFNTELLLKKAMRDEEVYWRGKARTTSLRAGNKNTAFFHAQTVQRRQQNRLVGLEDKNGNWCDGEQAVQGIAIDYFMHIFTSEGSGHVDKVLDCVDNRVTARMNRLLTRPISYNEVKGAVF